MTDQKKDTKQVLGELASKAKTLAGDPVLLGRYLVRLMQDERVPRQAKLKLLGSGLYTWVEGDIIPDDVQTVPGLGYVDDIILIVHGVKCLVAETDNHVAAELWPGDEASFRRVMTAVAWLDEQMYGRARGWVLKALDKIIGKATSITNER
ncbi:MAG: hypothetical protein GY847_15575 [Proteobacteria bacterium]|nr:hypothetical protein [Pseudomonadota bacterium]